MAAGAAAAAIAQAIKASGVLVRLDPAELVNEIAAQATHVQRAGERYRPCLQEFWEDHEKAL